MSDSSCTRLGHRVFVVGRELLEASIVTGGSLNVDLISNGSADGLIEDVDVTCGVVNESSTRTGGYHGSLDSVQANLACLNGSNRADRSLDWGLWGNFLRTRQKVEGGIDTMHIIVRAIAVMLSIVLDSLLDIIIGNHHSSIPVEGNGPIDTLWCFGSYVEAVVGPRLINITVLAVDNIGTADGIDILQRRHLDFPILLSSIRHLKITMCAAAWKVLSNLYDTIYHGTNQVLTPVGQRGCLREDVIGLSSRSRIIISAICLLR